MPRLILAILLLTAPMVYSQPVNSQPPNQKAGIYSTKVVPPLRDWLLAVAPTAKISEGQEPGKTSFSCEWPDVTVRLTIKPDWNRSIQSLQMKNWISGFPVGTNTPAISSLLRQVDATVSCIGCVSTPRYDPAGKALLLILGLAAKLDGYVFSEKSFYDRTGSKIIGVPEAPLKLKDQK